ncbi:MAG: hypothetical protein WBX81_15260 [Nitrososphaeraceae archaeon]
MKKFLEIIGIDPKKTIHARAIPHLHKAQVHNYSRLVMILILNADIGGSKVESRALFT